MLLHEKIGGAVCWQFDTWDVTRGTCPGSVLNTPGLAHDRAPSGQTDMEMAGPEL
jgi:hypothetical protein